MAFETEVVDDVAVDRCKLLDRLHLSEFEHSPLYAAEQQVAVLHSVFEPARPPLAAIKILRFAHRRETRSQAVGDDFLRLAGVLQRLFYEGQGRSFVSLLCHEAVKDLALVVDSAPHAMRRAVDQRGRRDLSQSARYHGPQIFRRQNICVICKLRWHRHSAYSPRMWRLSSNSALSISPRAKRPFRRSSGVSAGCA